MRKSRRRLAGRQKTNALVPVFGKRALPQIYLQETKASVPAVFLPESGDSGAGARLKWLFSTCLAGIVGVGVIGVSVYASMNVDDGSGVVSSIRRASLAAMQPIQLTRAVREDQTVAGEKTDRIQATSRGLTTRQIIHDTVVQRVSDRDYIKLKPYARVVARLATSLPDDIQNIPHFNPFKLYANPKPISDTDETETGDGVNREVTVRTLEFEGGLPPAGEGPELAALTVAKLVAALDERVVPEGPYAMRPAILPKGVRDLAGRGALVQRAAYRPEGLRGPDVLESEVQPNTTVVEKTWYEPDDEVIQDTEVKTVKVGRGDTLMSILTDNGAERWQAREIVQAMAPLFPAKSLQKGQEVHFALAPAPSDSGQMEPVKVSVFTGDKHEVTVVRNGAGQYVASDEAIDLATAKRQKSLPTHATLYTSFYDSALNQNLPLAMITRVLRIHSYDVDFKRRVQPGDTFEVFYDLEKDDNGQESKPGELLYTSMTVQGETRRFFRFRSPDGVVDFFDEQGNSAKKFLMRTPVKDARLTSSFGMRRHPLLGYRRMHTGADWAAPRGTPIMAAGNGVVEEVGRKGGYGNYVRIRHANGYKTAYAHMNSFAKGMRPGVKVSQGQVIGYVGSTGISSGPHVHYEVLVSNRPVNPMTIHVPRGRQLTGRLLADFQKERRRIEALMQRAPVTTRVAAATPQDAR